MDTAARDTHCLDADAFLRMDQAEFGRAWRYELVRGAIARHLGNRLEGHRTCRLEIGSGAVRRYERRDTARIPDATIRCGDLPRVLFEVISPSELTHKRQWDQKPFLVRNKLARDVIGVPIGRQGHETNRRRPPGVDLSGR